jgi:hypothetical protein
MTSIKEQLAAYLAGLGKSVVNPDRKSNVGTLLFEVYTAAELANLAEKKAEQAWEQLEVQGLIPSDDKLRREEGERIVVESGHLSAMIKVSAPRQTFDKEAFITAVCKKYKLPVAAITALADGAKKVGKAALSKKVLEV